MKMEGIKKKRKNHKEVECLIISERTEFKMKQYQQYLTTFSYVSPCLEIFN